MHDGDYETAAKEWTRNCVLWAAGAYPEQDRAFSKYYFEYDPPPVEYGERGCPMFEHPRDDLTHWALYESTTEGTQLSPAFESIEEVALWAADNTTTFADFKTTAADWLRMLTGGQVKHREGNMVFI
jgi:hypothetical protein